MIQFASKDILDFITFLDEKYPTKYKVNICILHGFDSVAIGQDSAAFAVYVSSKKSRTIYVAGELSRKLRQRLKVAGQSAKEFIFRSIAHEFYHFLCDVGFELNCEGFDDDDRAENFANIMVGSYEEK